MVDDDVIILYASSRREYVRHFVELEFRHGIVHRRDDYAIYAMRQKIANRLFRRFLPPSVTSGQVISVS